ncbi:hypothetical protein ANO14919_008230 [Xylariales sp. No.14919]|nr:hypothetical protein ANO14919_008230 [Xylariales sp. No.14919]
MMNDLGYNLEGAKTNYSPPPGDPGGGEISPDLAERLFKRDSSVLTRN